MKTRLGWMHDIHLDHIRDVDLAALEREVRDARLDGLLLGGDVSTAHRLEDDLRRLASWLDGPLYVVLGNHDYYGSSVAGVRRRMEALHDEGTGIVWLPRAGTVVVGEKTALVGHGGWADGRLGDWDRSEFFLSDYALIEEFKAVCPGEELTATGLLSAESKRGRLALLNRLGDEAAAHFRRVLPEAVGSHPSVILLTHVPPFREAAWYEGKISNDDALPHFASRAAGEALRAVMEAHPDRELLVLCGHTHGAGEARILPNLRVVTGGARYGRPGLQDVLEPD
jgi:predicted phosphohydrolase